MPKINEGKYKKKYMHKDAIVTCCKEGRLDFLRMIVFDFDHSIDFLDEEGKSPLDYAEMYGHLCAYIFFCIFLR